MFCFRVLLLSPVSTIPLSIPFPCQYHSPVSTIPLSVPFHCQYHSPVSTIPLSVPFPCQYHSPVSTIPLSVPFHQSSKLTFIYTLLWPGGPTDEPCEPSINQCVSTAGPRHQLYRAARGLRKLQYATRFH